MHLRYLVMLMMAFVIGSCFAVALPAQAAQVDALAKDTPWRVFLVCGSVMRGTAAEPKPDSRSKLPEHTALPPADWAQATFDDSGWGRYTADLYDAIGGYGFDQVPSTVQLCLRTRFGVADPAQAKDLQLTLEYRGGVVIYVNGKEVARQHLPAGAVAPMTLAEDYPAEAFTDAAGAPLAAADRPADENPDRYEKRIRRLTVAIPPETLRKGANVLAIELHRATSNATGKAEWSTAGLCDAKLTSATGAGVIPYAEATRGVTIWNASPLDTVAAKPGKLQAGFLWWGVTITPAGLSCGNPFDPIQPIRTVAPRGGTCSGQMVVTAAEPLQGVKATMGPLTQVQGNATIPPAGVQVRYAEQENEDAFCNGLMPQPADGQTVQPVWVLVDVPRTQAPGWYTGVLTVTAGARTARVPVQVLVSAWTLPDPKENATFVSLYQSPDTLALQYKVAPWSDAHFALIDKSMAVTEKLGNDTLLVPIILDNYLGHKTGMVRWVRKGNGYEPEYSALERYLDLYIKHYGTPKVACLSIWKPQYGNRAWFRGTKVGTPDPVMVTELDPQTGTMTPMQAPNFGDPGSEAFWKPMIDGVRRILKARGCDDRFVLLGEGFDSRPLEPVVKFFQQIEPGMRWVIYSHWVRDPNPTDGKLIALGDMETGLRINPNGGGLPEMSRSYPNVPKEEFLTACAHRTDIHYTSSPLSYRNVMRTSGTIARLGADFWPIVEGRGGRRASLYSGGMVCGWLYRGLVPALTAAGPDGAVPTTRGQMLAECLQETELLVYLTRAMQTAPPDVCERFQQCQTARQQANIVGDSLSQAQISLDWNGMSAQEYALAAALAGEKEAGEWSKPPTAELAQ